MTAVEAIHDADAEALASIFEAAFSRLGELGRAGGEAVRARLKDCSEWEIEEGLAQLGALYS